MGYIMELRKLVGHAPLMQVGASVIVEDECGRVLLQLRNVSEYNNLASECRKKLIWSF